MKDVFKGGLKYSVNRDKYLYIINKKNNTDYLLKRINMEDSKDIVIIKITENIINIHNNKDLNNFDKDIIVGDIFSVLNDNYIVNNLIDLDELELKIKKSYINYIICNNYIGLSAYSINSNELDIVMLETNSIVGNIIINDDILINVDYNIKEDVLKLLKKYFMLFKKDNIKYLKKIK